MDYKMHCILLTYAIIILIISFIILYYNYKKLKKENTYLTLSRASLRQRFYAAMNRIRASRKLRLSRKQKCHPMKTTFNKKTTPLLEALRESRKANKKFHEKQNSDH